MSIYRRGAVYWWCRSVALGNCQLKAIKLRVSLKTSDKSEAKRRAAMLEVELAMVVVKFPVSETKVPPEQIRAIFKQAAEYKRDQIVDIQTRPQFNDAEHRRYNTAYSRIFGAIAHTGGTPDNPKTLALALNDEQLDEDERDLIRQLAVLHGIPTEAVKSYSYDPNSSKQNVAMIDRQQCMSKPAVAPRLVMNYMENAELTNTPVHQKIALAVTAAAYGKACIEANQRLGFLKDNAEFVIPVSLQTQMGWNAEEDLLLRQPSAEANVVRGVHAHPTTDDGIATPEVAPLPAAATPVQPPRHSSVDPQLPPTITPGTIDLKLSELCQRAITEYSRTKTWANSAQRNARVITDIFVTENGDLRVSEITRNHLLLLDARLKKMPAVWGKSREDRQGGLRHVFQRGEHLAAYWAADAIKAEREKLPKVGLSAGTYNRHIKTLKQVLDFVEVIAEIDKTQIYALSNVSFARLHEVDGRRKNKRKPVPFASELQTLISGPIHTGCASASARFLAGSEVIHDGAYWVPLLLTVYGPRSNEFCQMPLANAKIDACEAFFSIRESIHQTIKTAPSDRDLPIAPKLLELGFADYVRALKARGEFWLFPEFNTTKVPARKRFREMVFVPMLDHHFPNGTSNAFLDKDIDTQSLRKFATTFLRKHKPEIELGVRQSYFGHSKKTTLEESYEDDHTLDELMPCVLRMQQLIMHLKPFPLKMRPLLF